MRTQGVTSGFRPNTPVSILYSHGGVMAGVGGQALKVEGKMKAAKHTMILERNLLKTLT